ncbi:hypothetical protein ACVWZ4_005321 [Bradyrhizobium sp. USDA 4472]
MTKFAEIVHEFTAEELEAICGGMKWDQNYRNPEVIDARGGSFTMLGCTITYDPSGKVTSVGRT